MILLIDNYDSFTYNLVQRFGEIDPKLDLRVFRNDALDPAGIAALRPAKIVVSPGPCTPAEAGVSKAAIREFAGKVPILGVCLGHQCLGEVFGGKVVRAARVMHGKTSPIHHDGLGLFLGLPNPFIATRYHSLLVERGSFDDREFVVSAWTDEGEIMGLRHRRHAALDGVQFHPESFLTEHGPLLLRNFLAL